MTDKSFKEKRRYLRFVNADISYKTKEIGKEESPPDSVQAVAIDMSAEGICFRSPTKLRQGAIVKLDVVVPYQLEPLHLEGEVRWSKPIQTEEGKEMFDTGIKLFIFDQSDESKFLLYICEKMAESLKELEDKLE